MAHAPLSRFPIRITAAGEDADPATVDDFAQTLRQELIDAGAHRIERVPAGPAPEGTRSLELIGLLSFIITATDAGESLAKVIRAIRAVAKRYAQARRPVQVTVGDSDIDLATADDEKLASVVAAIEASRPPGVRAALIVANAAYDHAGLTQLRAPGADADALAGVLRDPAIGGFDVELVTDGDERTIRRRLAAFFARRDRDDVLLLHFSCHGVKDFRGRLYFAARDTDLDTLGATAVPASFVNDLLDETQAGRVVLILDCCYSGAFARGAATRGDDTVHVNDEFGGGTGRIVLTASSATEYAFEGTALTRADGQPSVFTSALVQGLASGGADLDEDGDISIDELYDYTYRAVRRATPGQAPMKWSYGVEGAVVIARSGRLPALPRSVLDDLDSDRGVLRMEGVKALQRILRDGTAGLRAAAVEALQRLRDNDDSLRVRQAADSALNSIVPVQAAAPGVETRTAIPPAPVTPRPTDAAPVTPRAAVMPTSPSTERATVEPATAGLPTQSTSESAPDSATSPASSARGSAASPAARDSAAATPVEPTPRPATPARMPAASPPAEFAPAPAAPRSETPPPRSAPADPAPWPTPATTSATQASTPAVEPLPSAAKHASPSVSPTTSASSAVRPTAATPTSSAPVGQPTMRRLGIAEPRPQGVPAPAREPVTDRLAGARLFAAVLAGLLALAAALTYVVTIMNHPDTDVERTGIDMTYGVLSVTALVALVTRRQAWAAVLAGLLAWLVAFPIAISADQWHSSLGTTYPSIVTGMFLAIGAFICAIPAALPASDPTAERSRRVIIVLVVTPLAVTSGILLVEVVCLLYGHTGTSGSRLVAGVAALILPVAGLLAPRDRATHYLLGGWLLGGAIFGITGTADMFLSGGWRFATWLPLVAAGIAAAIAFRRSAARSESPR